MKSFQAGYMIKSSVKNNLAFLTEPQDLKLLGLNFGEA